MPPTPRLWTARTIPRLATLALALTSLLFLIALATVLRAAYKSTYYVSFGAPAWAGLFMIGPCLTILHSTAVLTLVLIGRGPLKSGVEMALDFVGIGANGASAALLILQASFAGEMLRSCDEPGDSEREWCGEARTILGLEATAVVLVLVVGYVVCWMSVS